MNENQRERRQGHKINQKDEERGSKELEGEMGEREREMLNLQCEEMKLWGTEL